MKPANSASEGILRVEVRSEGRNLPRSEIVFRFFYPLHCINDVGQALRVELDTSGDAYGAKPNH